MEKFASASSLHKTTSPHSLHPIRFEKTALSSVKLFFAREGYPFFLEYRRNQLNRILRLQDLSLCPNRAICE